MLARVISTAETRWKAIGRAVRRPPGATPPATRLANHGEGGADDDLLPRAAGVADRVCLNARMARNARPTAAKREREKALLERRQQKAARRQDVKQSKGSEPSHPEGEDPDIAHIKLGPQPPADWQIEE